jgi:hypothetical protein
VSLEWVELNMYSIHKVLRCNDSSGNPIAYVWQEKPSGKWTYQFFHEALGYWETKTDGVPSEEEAKDLVIARLVALRMNHG